MSDQTPNAPIQVGAGFYRIGKLGIFDQMAIMRRMMPVLKHIMTPDVLSAIAASREAGKGLDLSKIDLKTMIPAVMDAFYSLTDEDMERIVRTCLKVVSRQNEKTGGMFSAVMTQQGIFMFEDIGTGDAMSLTWKVIEAHFESFFSIAP